MTPTNPAKAKHETSPISENGTLKPPLSPPFQRERKSRRSSNLRKSDSPSFVEKCSPTISSGDAVNIIPRQLGLGKRPIRILSAGAKGGPGKTFLCKNLASSAASEGYNVALVDFDRQRSLTKWLGRRSSMSPDKAAIIGYMADPSDVSDAQEVLEIVSHDFIFFDTPPAIDQHSEVLKTLAFGADLILVPSAVGITDTESAEVLLRLLADWHRPTLAILNKVKLNANRVIGLAKKRLVRNTELCPIEIGEYYDFLAADEIGLGATEMDVCVGKDDIEAVWSIVKRRLNLGC
jgi:chromosome partitioning protein